MPTRSDRHPTSTAAALGLLAVALACTTPLDEVEPGGSGSSGEGSTLGSGGPESSSGGAQSSGGVVTGGADSSGDGMATGGEDSTGPGSEPPLDDVLRMSHVQVKGTHNSYHLEPTLPLHGSHEYSQPTLPDQLQLHGVRAFELDVHRDLDGTISVYHILAIDDVTSCGTFEICLGQIKGWSDLNPDHLPIVVWVEVKDDTGGLPIDDLGDLDAIVTDVFDDDQLLTPDEVQGEYASLHERLVTEGWPTLGEVRGQVLVVVLDGDAGSDYSGGYSDLSGRPMFVRVGGGEFESPVAAIAKLGAGDAETIAAAHANNLLIATNVCAADESDDECFAQRDEAIAAGIHMLKDDYPAPVPDREYWLDLPEGDPSACNPVTAPPRCEAAALEP